LSPRVLHVLQDSVVPLSPADLHSRIISRHIQKLAVDEPIEDMRHGLAAARSCSGLTVLIRSHHALLQPGSSRWIVDHKQVGTQSTLFVIIVLASKGCLLMSDLRSPPPKPVFEAIAQCHSTRSTVSITSERCQGILVKICSARLKTPHPTRTSSHGKSGSLPAAAATNPEQARSDHPHWQTRGVEEHCAKFSRPCPDDG
jgi:hypothetical protein